MRAGRTPPSPKISRSAPDGDLVAQTLRGRRPVRADQDLAWPGSKAADSRRQAQGGHRGDDPDHTARGDAVDVSLDGQGPGTLAGDDPAHLGRERVVSPLGPTFKVSNDKHFVDKLTDVVGLYLNPPDKAMVLCVDEKSQIQALDRTQPSLPMKRGRSGTMTHDYKRNGTTTLFAALDVLTGTVIGQCLPRHRHDKFLRFLRKIDRSVPKGLELHLIVDNYGTHNHPNVRAWLEKHPRFHLHFTPTSSSWLNLVERWFRDLTQRRLKRGVFASVPELIEAIEEYMRIHNDDPKPFVWTASVQSILDKVNRCKAILETVH